MNFYFCAGIVPIIFPIIYKGISGSGKPLDFVKVGPVVVTAFQIEMPVFVPDFYIIAVFCSVIKHGFPVVENGTGCKIPVPTSHKTTDQEKPVSGEKVG